MVISSTGSGSSTITAFTVDCSGAGGEADGSVFSARYLRLRHLLLVFPEEGETAFFDTAGSDGFFSSFN